MRFKHTCIEAFGYAVPEEIISSDEIERRLQPLYERLRLPAGRLELMTGICERRIWPDGMLPSEQSIRSGRRALEAANWDPRRIGALIHASVCRDHLEPATACRVHHELGLPGECQIYDVSNACLGILNGMLQVAAMIESGQIEAGLVVGTENSRQLLETTIASLNADNRLTRDQTKSAVASLTIGSGSCAVLLVDRRESKTGTRLVASACRANSAHHRLCHSGRDEAAANGMSPLMQTDSEALLQAGIATGVETFVDFCGETTWGGPGEPVLHKSCCHQVGAAHRRLMLESLDLPIQNDFATFPWLGNTGSVALPITTALAAEFGHLQPGDRFGMLGIGSGINCIMVGVDWQRVFVFGNREAIPQHEAVGTMREIRA